MKKSTMYAALCCLVCVMCWNRITWRSVTAGGEGIDVIEVGESGESITTKGKTPEQIAQEIEMKAQQDELVARGEQSDGGSFEETGEAISIKGLPTKSQLEEAMQESLSSGDVTGFQTAAKQYYQISRADASQLSTDQLNQDLAAAAQQLSGELQIAPQPDAENAAPAFTPEAGQTQAGQRQEDMDLFGS